LNVNGNVDGEQRNIEVQNKNDQLSQQWDVVYAEDWKGEPQKGELNEEFGLYVERPFYIVSRLASHRYLDLINNRNMVIKTPNGRNTQTWWFDQKSLTIRTKLNNQSWDIQSAGKTNNMQIWSTNSGWFQIFLYEGSHFCNIRNHKCLNVSGNKDAEGQTVDVTTRGNGAH
jgi:membrane carboxypeptidase/penicillin-binding protein PbpC